MREIAVLFFLTFFPVCTAATYYVAPYGNDVSGNGSIENPWYTLNKAWTVVVAGDTLYMRGGTYNYIKQVLTGKSGREGQLIKIWSYPGEIPILTKSGAYKDTEWPRSIVRVSGDYIHIRGLEICYNTQENNEAYYGLINHNGNYNIYELLNIHHNGWAGIGIEYNSTGNLILNCDIHHNSDPLSSYKYGNADGIGLGHLPENAINTIRGCRIWCNSDDGIDTYGCDSKLVIDSCWSWYNGFVPDTFTAAGNGIGFKLGKTLKDCGNAILMTVSNCIAYKNRASGFHQNGAVAVFALVNNTAYLNGSDGFWFGSYNKPHILKNNISYKNASYCTLSTSAIVMNNTFMTNSTENPYLSLTDEDFISLDSLQLNNPRKDDGSLPEIEFLHLKSGSDLIDSGVDAGLPYSGKAPDIGAFELTMDESHLNQHPVISIASPAKGDSYNAPATITINIEAFDPDGTISKVELYSGTKKISERTVVPFEFTLKDLPVGFYSLNAVATDNLSAATTSAPLTLQVTSSYNENGEFFNLYPNPNDGHFSISFTSSQVAETYTVTIFNQVGRTVYHEEFLKGNDFNQFDLSQLNSGIYILMISTDSILMTQKFIKG